MDVNDPAKEKMWACWGLRKRVVHASTYMLLGFGKGFMQVINVCWGFGRGFGKGLVQINNLVKGSAACIKEFHTRC